MTKQQTDIRCSFCLRRTHEVTKIIAGPGSFICDKCVDLCNEILATETARGESAAESTSDSVAGEPGEQPELPSWHTMTDEQLLARLPGIAASADLVEGALRQWVGEARRRGTSWARIGGVLDMSRQAAWERFTQEERRD